MNMRQKHDFQQFMQRCEMTAGIYHLEYQGGANGTMNRVVIDVQISGRDTDTGLLLDPLRSADGSLFVC